MIILEKKMFTDKNLNYETDWFKYFETFEQNQLSHKCFFEQETHIHFIWKHI